MIKNIIYMEDKKRSFFNNLKPVVASNANTQSESDGDKEQNEDISLMKKYNVISMADSVPPSKHVLMLIERGTPLTKVDDVVEKVGVELGKVL